MHKYRSGYYLIINNVLSWNTSTDRPDLFRWLNIVERKSTPTHNFVTIYIWNIEKYTLDAFCVYFLNGIVIILQKCSTFIIHVNLKHSPLSQNISLTTQELTNYSITSFKAKFSTSTLTLNTIHLLKNYRISCSRDIKLSLGRSKLTCFWFADF